MILTAEQLARSIRMQIPVALSWLPAVDAVLARNGITDGREIAMFLAQTGHESASFSRLEENLNYNTRGLLTTFPRHFGDSEHAALYARRPAKIANRVYANRLGNGDEQSGDGWEFRGRGLIQVTGRDNYRECGEALGIDLEADPGKLLTQKYAVASAAWYWTTRECGKPARKGDVKRVTRIINGGLHGIEDRIARYNNAIDALGIGSNEEDTP